MPIAVQSGPIVFDTSATPKPARTPRPAKPPKTTPPTPTATPQPTGAPGGGQEFVSKHAAFITKISSLPACFSRTDIPEITDEEFDTHTAVAIQDRYITKSNNTYCTMTAVSNMVSALRRFREEKEVI